MKSSDDDTKGILLAAGEHEREEKMRETRKTLLDGRDVPREGAHEAADSRVAKPRVSSVQE